MRNVLWALALGIASVVGGTMPARAQGPHPNVGDSIVVTASAIKEEKDRLPATVTVLDRTEIEARQVPSLGELLATVPGMSVATAGPPGQQTSAFLRGAESDQTLLLWNGAELNSPYFGAVNWQFVPTEGADRVEVARGPYSALYGGNAVGGVVQLITGKSQRLALRLEGGDNNFLRGALSAGRKLGAVDARLMAQSRRGDSEFVNGFFDADDLALKLDWSPSERTTLGLLGRWDDSETGIPFVSGLPNDSASIAWKETSLVLPYSFQAASWSLAGQASSVASDYAFRDPEDAFGFVRSDTDAEALRARLVGTFEPRAALRVSVGASADRLEASDNNNFGTNLDGAHQRTWALFGEASLALSRLRLDLGLRRDDNDVYGEETSLRAGLSLRLSDHARLRGGYGEAFRPPTLGELFFPFSGNATLEPERAESYELGVELTPGPLTLELTAFHLEQSNLIDFDLAAFRFENVARARSRGLEGALRLRYQALDLRLAATYLEAENLVKNTPLLRRPKESASLVASFAPQPWALTLTARYVGKRPDFDAASGASVTNPSFLRLDLGGRYQVGERFAPYARVENALDRSYEEVSGFPAPSRTWVAGLSLTF